MCVATEISQADRCLVERTKRSSVHVDEPSVLSIPYLLGLSLHLCLLLSPVRTSKAHILIFHPAVCLSAAGAVVGRR